jgi:hypothetical protein
VRALLDGLRFQNRVLAATGTAKEKRLHAVN